VGNPLKREGLKSFVIVFFENLLHVHAEFV